jgi:hypothetical protein
MDALSDESISLGITGIVLIWFGPLLENILIKAFGIKHPYRERESYEDLDQKK